MGEATKPVAEAEASDGWASVLGAVVLYSPVLVACGLGCAKAWPMVQGLV